MDLKLLAEPPMLSSISNLSDNWYESINESLELIFNPIVANIIKDLEEQQ